MKYMFRKLVKNGSHNEEYTLRVYSDYATLETPPIIWNDKTGCYDATSFHISDRSSLMALEKAAKDGCEACVWDIVGQAVLCIDQG